jgi:hypothetical protein
VIVESASKRGRSILKKALISCKGMYIRESRPAASRFKGHMITLTLAT